MKVTSPERTWCDLSVQLGFEDLVAAGDYLIRREFPITTKERLRQAVAGHPGRRGKSQLRLAISYLNDRSESPQESRLRVIIMRAGIPDIVANLPITTSGGYHYRGDLAFPEAKVVVEYQSDYHSGTAQFRLDMTRRTRLEADGWFVILVNADDLRDPVELVQRIRTVLVARASTRLGP